MTITSKFLDYFVICGYNTHIIRLFGCLSRDQWQICDRGVISCCKSQLAMHETVTHGALASCLSDEPEGEISSWTAALRNVAGQRLRLRGLVCMTEEEWGHWYPRRQHNLAFPQKLWHRRYEREVREDHRSGEMTQESSADEATGPDCKLPTPATTNPLIPPVTCFAHFTAPTAERRLSGRSPLSHSY